MVADAIAWACRSPRRLAALLIAPAAVVIAVLALRPGTAAPIADPARANAADRAAAAPGLVPDAGPFVAAAVTFVEAWSGLAPGQSAGQWHDAVAGLATPDLAAALAQTDPATLPDGEPQGEPIVRFVSTSSALIAVPLSTGGSVAVTVVSDGPGWRVADVQPDVGDFGAEDPEELTPRAGAP